MAAQEAAHARQSNRTTIVLDTLGKLRARGYRVWGNCLDGAGLYRKDIPAALGVSAAFEIDLDGLIAERGADTSFICMAPVPCPRCGGRCTETRTRVPGKTTQ